MSRKKKKVCYCGVGGQAVLEGVMMKNKDLYAVAIRKSNGEIVIDTKEYAGVLHDNILTKIPFIRGIFNFIDSLILGMKTLNYSAEFYEDEEEEPTKADKALDKATGGHSDKVFMAFAMLLSVILCVGVFIALPYFLSSLFAKYIRNTSLLNIIEGVIRIVIFLLYVLLISLMKDIRRVYMYHGAEHKCINCIERGRELTVSNVRRSSRQHRRCGTSFLLFVMLVSVILFFFIRVNNPVYRILLRIAMIPAVAGISYELIRLAGRFDNPFTRILSAPGMLLQKITTKEPTDEMIEVGIRSVEAVFDWKEFLKEKFDYDVEATTQYESDAEDEKENESDEDEEIETVAKKVDFLGGERRTIQTAKEEVLDDGEDEEFIEKEDLLADDEDEDDE